MCVEEAIEHENPHHSFCNECSVPGRSFLEICISLAFDLSHTFTLFGFSDKQQNIGTTTRYSSAFVTQNIIHSSNLQPSIMGNRQSSTSGQGGAAASPIRFRRSMASAAAVGDCTITGVLAREILDSRGNPTVEVSFHSMDCIFQLMSLSLHKSLTHPHTTLTGRSNHPKRNLPRLCPIWCFHGSLRSL